MPLIMIPDIALHLGCNTDDLTSSNEFAGKIPVTTHYLLTNRNEEDGFWGHFGVKLRNHSKSKWYPITISTANQISNHLQCIEKKSEWLIIETLNNRMLIINPSSVDRLWLLDDAQDDIGEDWSIPIDGYTGQASEFYRALEAYCFYEEEIEYSKKFLEIIKNFTDANDFGFDEQYEFLFYTHIFNKKGESSSYEVPPENLVTITNNIEIGEPSIIFDLSCDSFDSYFPSDAICMLDTPLNQIVKTYKEMYY